MTEIIASWSDIPGVTLTESTNVGLFVRKISNMLFSLVGSCTIWVRQLSFIVETKSWYMSGFGHFSLIRGWLSSHVNLG